MITSVDRKETELPTPWNSEIPKKFKPNVIVGDLHRSKQTSTNFTKEKNIIENKFKKADCPAKFIDSGIKRFEYNERNIDPQDDFIILIKSRIVAEIQFCELNGKRVSTFRKNFNYFPNDSVEN